MGRSVLSLRDRARGGCLLENRTLGIPPAHNRERRTYQAQIAESGA